MRMGLAAVALKQLDRDNRNHEEDDFVTVSSR
jgi:hypothetical protein